MSSRRGMMILVVFFLSFAALWAGEIHCEHFFLGMPRGSSDDNDLIIRDLYALSNNGETRFADWVAYRLTPEEVFGTLDLEREWRNDPWLSDDETLRAKPKSADEYAGANSAYSYERGHLAPLASFRGSAQASSVNFYSNIVPQTRVLNNGPWKHLEAGVREMVLEGRTVYVLTGPYYDDDEPMPALPAARPDHRVPSGFWKIVSADLPGGPKVSAFLFSQYQLNSEDFRDSLVSVDEIEAKTGLDIFPQLNRDSEIEIESRIELIDAFER